MGANYWYIPWSQVRFVVATSEAVESCGTWGGSIISWKMRIGLQKPSNVKKGPEKQQGLAWIHKQQIYKNFPISECEQEGKIPITMKWIDRNKGDLERPNYRSRLVCREVKRAKGAEYIPEHASFSSMPPLEALKASPIWYERWKMATFKSHSRQNGLVNIHIPWSIWDFDLLIPCICLWGKPFSLLNWNQACGVLPIGIFLATSLVV